MKTVLAVPLGTLCACIALDVMAQQSSAPRPLPSQYKDGFIYYPNGHVVKATKANYTQTKKAQTYDSRSQGGYTASATRSPCNLVTNGDFEDQTITPTGNFSNIISRAPSGGGTTDELANWESTSLATPDYFATNAPISTSTFGNTNPATSFNGPFTPYDNTPNAHNGCIGLYGSDQSTPYRGAPYAEYVTQKITKSLDSRHNYYASMQVYSASYMQYASPIGLYVTVNDPRNYGYTLGPNSLNPVTFAPPSSSSGCGFQSGFIGNSQWTPVTGIFPGVDNAQYLNIGNFQAANAQLVRSSASDPFAYMYVDNVEIYQIPSAGLATSVTCSTPTVIGEGCDIPGATYAWTVQGGSNVPFARTIQTNVPSQSGTTTYILTVTLPNNAGTSATTVTVTGSSLSPDYPIAGQVQQDLDNCTNTAHFRIYNYDSNVTYKINRGAGNPTPIQVTGWQYFIIKTSGGATEASFTITATNGCGSVTTEELTAYYSCDEQGTTTNRTAASTAYPNPANQTLTLPDYAQDAILVDGQGNIVRKATKQGKLDVQSLPDGLYNLRTRQNGKVVNQRIQVQH